MKTASTRSDQTASTPHVGRPHVPFDVLLAEDDTFLAGHLGRALSRAGLEVRRARAGRDALAEAVCAPPDVLVLELELHDLTGYEVVRALREERVTRGVPVLLLTRRGDPQTRAAAWSAGADGLLARPFLPAELLSAVSVLAARGRRERKGRPSAAESVRLLRGLLEVHAPAACAAGEARARVAVAFGAWIGLDDRALLRIEHAALLQDCGRMLLPDETRDAAGRASAPHALLGARLLSALPELEELVPLVRHHHERHDGRGFPDGLRGADVPPPARVLALADAWCSLREIAGAARPSQGALLRALQRLADDGAFDSRLARRFADAVAAGQVA